MLRPTDPARPELRAGLLRLYREFFDLAERRRRWSLADDIPWAEVNRAMDPAIADVVESFCAVELYLPDYIAKALPLIRVNRGWAWFHANWGYEESKHSMALGDWLLRSGMRSDEQMADLEGQVFAQEWDLPHDNARAMVIYTMVQELATWLHYRNLREVVGKQGDPALYKVLTLVATDERAHYDFFRKLVQIYLEDDHPGTLEQLRRVVNYFAMPAVHLLADSRKRMEEVKNLRIFDYDIYYYQVFEPVVQALGLKKSDLRRHARREVAPPAAVRV